MKNHIFFVCSFLLTSSLLAQENARYREFTKVYKTYPFSDPDPVPAQAKLYPYFRFDGFTDKPVEQPWKVVLLENDYIEVEVMPEIGGKIWTATDKKTGKPFLYDNDVVKFRDIAMRGPWLSGGIEPNYGVIGHTPNTATPVDYLVRGNHDGSVSCFVSTLDLLTRTRWVLEIKLEKEKAYFTTRSFWFNSTGMENPYYTWMNAGIPAGEDLQFLYPGTHYIGHGGEAEAWSIDSTGRDLSYYNQNNFGGSKSYHVLGSRSKYFGAIWAKDDFGMIRYAPREDKLGKKIFLWAQSRSGGIWEDLLTDSAGQYVEIQSGRLFNQNQIASSATPFKQIGFEPYTSDTWTEYWYPFSELRGFSAANRVGAFAIEESGRKLHVNISPVQPFNDSLRIWDLNGKMLAAARVKALPRETVKVSVTLPAVGQASYITLAGERLDLKDVMPGDSLSRPVVNALGNQEHDNSAYGLYIQGRDQANFRSYGEAEVKIHQALEENAALVPALSQMARLKLHRMQYDSAFFYGKKALAVDTYDPAGNYYYGRAAEALGRFNDAFDGYEVASLSPFFREAAYTALAKLYIKQGDLSSGADYVEKAIHGQSRNLEALMLKYLIARRRGSSESMESAKLAILEADPLSHFIRFEAYLQAKDDRSRQSFKELIRSEMPVETYLELAIWYSNLKQGGDAVEVLQMAPQNAEVLSWLAWLNRDVDIERSRDYLSELQKANAGFVFPFRHESADVFEWVSTKTDDWKADYFLALIHQSCGNRERAAKLLSADNPNRFAPYYVLRARLANNKGQQTEDLRRAVGIDPKEWRYGVYLSRILTQQGKSLEATKNLKKYYHAQPVNYIVGLAYVRSLIDLSDYREAETILDRLHILPFEGATDARNYYRKTKLMLAQEALTRKQYVKALEKLDEAEEWPEQLGVGKPYDSMIDNSIEQVMRNKIFFISGKGREIAAGHIKDKKLTSDNYLKAIADLTRRQDERLF